jgi:putative iron-regulated protein
MRALFVAFAVTLAACGPSPQAAVVRRYAQNLDANYKDVIAALGGLKAAVDSFVAAPSAEGLVAAQQAWIAARPSYGECEVSRFYGGPIDHAQGGMNEWPIDESFIDYTTANAMGGIINDPQGYPQLTPAVLAMSDQRGGVENLSTGFHAIEFLLWGQRPAQTDGPGTRPHTDYLDGGTAAHQERRRTYLKSATDLLLSDMQTLEGEWDLTDLNSYASVLLTKTPKEGLTNIARGLSSMAIAELCYERLSDPFVTQDKKDEQSCFSETTIVDLKANALGVEDVYLGRYGGTSGASLSDLVRGKNRSLDAMLKQQLAALRAALDAIPPPFDHAVLAPAGSDPRQKVQAAVDACAPLRGLLEQMVATLGITVNI